MQSCYVDLEKSGRNLECKLGEGIFDRMLRICGISRLALCRNGSIRKKEGRGSASLADKLKYQLSEV